MPFGFKTIADINLCHYQTVVAPLMARKANKMLWQVEIKGLQEIYQAIL
jgi:hypothetical protein